MTALTHASPLFAPAWDVAMTLRRDCSATARRQLLTSARKAKDPAALLGLESQLRSTSEASPRAASLALRCAFTYLPQGQGAVIDFLQAVVAYASFSEVAQQALPHLGSDDPAKPLDDWLMKGARDFSEQLTGLGHGPVRQVLSYLRQVEGRPDAAERKWGLALLLPLAAASAARGMKEQFSSRDARLRLLALARWASEEGVTDAETLKRRILPVVQAVEAYQNYWIERNLRQRDDVVAPPDYLTDGYFNEGQPRAELFGAWAKAWAEPLTHDDTTASQFRRVFLEMRRLESLAREKAWDEVRPEVFSLAPLASDAAARALKENRDIRALAMLVHLNLSHVRGIRTPELQRDAFLRGTVPHFEAILARFNARKLPTGVSVPALPSDAMLLRDSAARTAAEELLQCKVSSGLLRRVYGAMRRLSICPEAAYAAELARTVTMAEEAVRRVGGEDEGQRRLLSMIRQAATLPKARLQEDYVPYLENMVRWFTGLEALTPRAESPTRGDPKR